jgi:UDP-N-acetylenolpyruvoylglucosamine reductase
MNIQENIDITYLSNFKTQAKAKYYFEINKESDIEKLKNVMSFSIENKLSLLFIGSGTNMLFAFEEYE